MSNKNIRSSQLLSPFGVGQIVNFPKEISFMVGGLDLWDEMKSRRMIQAGLNQIDESELRITEKRLQKLLGVEYFIKPYAYKTRGLTNNYLKIPAVRFPKWHYCTNPACGHMEQKEITYDNEIVECTHCSNPDKKWKSKMIPVRFVAVCQEGHIQDVPFKEWVHNGPVPKDNQEHHLSYHANSGSGDLSSILIKCTCGEKRSLAGLMNVRKEGNIIFDSALARIGFEKDDSRKFDTENKNDNNPSGQYCRGERPWLGIRGISENQNCNRHLQVLIRGGSNIHYANIISALYLPEVSSQADGITTKVIERQTKEHLKKLYEMDDGKMILPTVLANEIEVRNKLISIEELVEKIKAELFDSKTSGSEDVSEDDIRIEEYQFILNGFNSENSDFKAVVKSFETYQDTEYLSRYFDKIVLIEKLKETRVFRGFSRINASHEPNTKELSNEEIKWLPASEVYGEGIFLKFKDEKIKEWSLKTYSYFNRIISKYHSAMLSRSPSDEPRKLDSSFIMMHTFSHLLIKRLCFSCGYGSSSLRERIYFLNDDNLQMNGILIYTSSGDSEGSLGGLVKQGKEQFLAQNIKDAIEDARWCSADPVCSDIGQSSGQGPDNVNGSACHNCCIVPETSCEEFNSLLDRATVIGTFENSRLGYFCD